MDFVFILSNLHRFIRQRGRRQEPQPEPVARVKVHSSDRRFLTRVVLVAVLLLVAIVIMLAQL